MPSEVKFMGIRLRLAGKEETLAAIDAATAAAPLRIATPNPEFILEARKNPLFREALENSFCTVDGFGLQIGLWFWRLRQPSVRLVDRYTGADLVEDLLSTYADGSRSFYLLGGQSGVAEAASRRWKERFPLLRLVGVEDGGSVSRQDPRPSAEVANRIRTAAPDILVIAFGAPKQEIWMRRAQDLNVPVMLGVGGTFDFYVTKKRAPRIWRTLRLEWLYRGFTEKGHWKRIWRAFVVYVATFLWALVSGR